MLEPSANQIAFQKSLEGFEAKPYICPGGVPTIGYGTTFYPNTGVHVTMKDAEISEEKATEYLISDLRTRMTQVTQMLTWQPPDHVIEALVSLSRNIGIDRLASSTCMKTLNSGKGTAEQRVYDAAVALKMFNKAQNKKTGKLEVLGGLVSRRADEFDIMVNGWDSSAASQQTAATIAENPPSVLKSDRARWALAGIGAALLPVLAELPRIMEENPPVPDGDGVISWASYAGMAVALLMVLVRSRVAMKSGSFGSQGRAG